MERYIALLRGINVGGHKKVPMKILKEILENNGYQNVKTLLATGNVVFNAEPKQINEFRSIIESHFGFDIPTIIHPFHVITEIVNSNPFSETTEGPKIKYYITFHHMENIDDIAFPVIAEDDSYQIINISNIAVFSVLNLDKRGTVKFMPILEKMFGKNITTRTYKTVERISKL